MTKAGVSYETPAAGQALAGVPGLEPRLTEPESAPCHPCVTRPGDHDAAEQRSTCAPRSNASPLPVRLLPTVTDGRRPPVPNAFPRSPSYGRLRWSGRGWTEDER